MQGSWQANSVIAIYFSRQTIGVTYYNRTNLKIQCGLLQFYTPTSACVLHKVIKDKQVDFILTNNQKHPFILPFIESIRIAKIDERGLQDDIIQNNISILKFNPCKQHIQNKSQYIQLMKQISLSHGMANQKFKSLGMMLYHLLNNGDFSIASKIFLNDIDYFFDPIFRTVQVSTSELSFLQIIKQQIHPSLIKGKGRSKQGFSILNLYETYLSSAGSKRILRNIFKNPTYDRKTLEDRLNLIQWIKKYCNEYKILMKAFRSIHSVDAILHKFVECRVQTQDWRKLVKTLQSMIIIHKTLQQKIKVSLNNQIPCFLNLFFNEVNWAQIARVVSSVSFTIDLNQGTVKRGLDIQLDELKKNYDNLPHLLTLYARQQGWSEDIRIVFMTQIGYLIRIPHNLQNIESFINENWSLQFVKSSGKYFCNQLTASLDSEYGDIYGQITDREKKINFQLQNIVSEHSQTMLKAYWKICQIQCYVGIAIVCNGMVKPRLSSQSLIISNGWHMLLSQDAIQNHVFTFNQQQAPKGKVFNSEQNIVNTNYSNRIMLITGPNGSGKTIYMKQVTIIIFLAHLGFFVPAELAQIPLIDKIIVVQSKNSIYNNSNGFQSQISSLSRVAIPGLITNKSLILVDELGSSVDQALAKKMLATLVKFLSSAELSSIGKNQQLQNVSDRFDIPIAIIITHLTDVLSHSMVEQNYYVRYLTMAMEKDETYLFKIKPGLVRKGYGIECAKKFMDSGFIKRAQYFWQQIKQKI